MHFKKLITFSILVSSQFLFQSSNGQGTNLLQRYIQQYFKDYFQSTVRSYTLYGNGQNGPADYHAGLPYPYEKNGKVNSVIFSTSASAPLAPPKASAKRTSGFVENSWVYPGPMNNFAPPPDNTNNGFTGQQPPVFPQQQQQQQPQQFQQSRSDSPPVQRILQMPPGGVLVMDPQQSGEQPIMAESRMVELETPDSDADIDIISSSNFNNEYAEIPVQSAMTF